MNYIGSKFSLLPFIDEVIRNVAGNALSDKILCDIFAGTGIVGRYFKNKVSKVLSNDIEYYSYVLIKNYIENSEDIPSKSGYIDRLNLLAPIDTGFIYRNYCSGSGSGRQYFTDANGRKIDAVRRQIETWYRAGEISGHLYWFLLCSLVESADKVANTASVYGAFLKHVKKSAAKEMEIAPAEFELSGHIHEVFNEDANSLIRRISGDILYLDPPYNARQYGANYHLLNTIARYETFEPKGKTGLDDYYKSGYCRSGDVREQFEDLIKNASFKYVFLSYNNEGLMSPEDIRRIMSKYGRYDLAERKYHRFKADKTENRNHKADCTTEYLHILEKY